MRTAKSWAMGCLRILDSEANIAFWRQKSEGLQLIIADLLRTNQQLRASQRLHISKDSDDSANSHPNILK
jgi:hypothetical protein